MRLDAGSVRDFAAASGDRNPLHLDAGFARASVFGRPVAHGALLAISALASLPGDWLPRLSSVSASFSSPLFPDAEYRLRPAAPAGRAMSVVAEAAGTVIASFRCAIGPVADPAWPEPTAGAVSRPPDRALAVWRLGELGACPRWQERYCPARSALRDLAAALGAEAVPDRLLCALAWVSWLAGSRVPGRDGMLAGFTLGLTGQVGGAGLSRVRVEQSDARTGAVWLSARYETDGGAVRASVRAILRSPVPSPTPQSLARYLEPGSQLAGHHVAVIGASRGWGAAMAGALASQQATVWAVYARAHQQAARLRDLFGRERIRLHRCDAANPAEVGQLARRMRREGPPLSALVLAAAPPLRTIPARPEAVRAQLDFVQDTLALVANPLAMLGPLLRPREGWLVVASSAAVENPAAGLAHYVAAKAAAEGYTAAFAAEHRLRALLVRAPKMLTDMVNGPTGSIGATPPERVAAAATRALLAPGDAELGMLTPDLSYLPAPGQEGTT